MLTGVDINVNVLCVLDTLLTDSVLECLVLLYALAQCLDVEYMYGSTKCWKDLAEEFRILATTYERFDYCEVLSPTNQLFEYVISSFRPDMSIGELKSHLLSIERTDIKVLLQKHIESKGFLFSSFTLQILIIYSPPSYLEKKNTVFLSFVTYVLIVFKPPDLMYKPFVCHICFVLYLKKC